MREITKLNWWIPDCWPINSNTKVPGAKLRNMYRKISSPNSADSTSPQRAKSPRRLDQPGGWPLQKSPQKSFTNASFSGTENMEQLYRYGIGNLPKNDNLCVDTLIMIH